MPGRMLVTHGPSSWLLSQASTRSMAAARTSASSPRHPLDQLEPQPVGGVQDDDVPAGELPAGIR